MADAAAVRRLVRVIEDWGRDAPHGLLFAFQVRIDPNPENAAAEIAAMVDDDAPAGVAAHLACALLNIARDQFAETGNQESFEILGRALDVLERRPAQLLHLKAGGFDA